MFSNLITGCCQKHHHDAKRQRANILSFSSQWKTKHGTNRENKVNFNIWNSKRVKIPLIPWLNGQWKIPRLKSIFSCRSNLLFFSKSRSHVLKICSCYSSRVAALFLYKNIRVFELWKYRNVSTVSTRQKSMPVCTISAVHWSILWRLLCILRFVVFPL